MRSLLLLLPMFLAACSGGSDDTASNDTAADSGTDTDSDSGADSGTDSGTDTDSDSGTDSGTDTDSDSGSSPLAEDSVRFTYKGYTSTIDCAAAYDSEADFEGAFYQIECAVADDRSGSSSWGGSFTLKLFNPEARTYTADDLARYSTGGFSLLVYRGGGNAPGSLLTSSGYDGSAASFSDVDVAITAFDSASGRVAAEFSFGAVDRAGESWTVEGRFDEVFLPQ